MKLTTKLLKKLIKEELTRLTESDGVHVDVISQDEQDEDSIEAALKYTKSETGVASLENLADVYGDYGILYIEAGGSIAEIDLRDISSVEDVSDNLSDFDEDVKAMVLQKIENAENQ
tara:strand:- start:22409 stop:22759 length:351 start_codon:yes stop_codon:yes gene_type:complete